MHDGGVQRPVESAVLASHALVALSVYIVGRYVLRHVRRTWALVMYVETRSHILKQALQHNKTHFMCTLDIIFPSYDHYRHIICYFFNMNYYVIYGNTLISTSLQLKLYRNSELAVNDDSFDVDNIQPASLILGNEDEKWLSSLSELEKETILAKHVEMFCSKHMMRKALRHASFLVNDEVSEKLPSKIDAGENAFIPIMAEANQDKEATDVPSEGVDIDCNVAGMSLVENTMLVPDPSCVPVRGRGRPPRSGASSRDRGHRGRSLHRSRGSDNTLLRGRGRHGGGAGWDANVVSKICDAVGGEPQINDNGVGVEP